MRSLHRPRTRALFVCAWLFHGLLSHTYATTPVYVFSHLAGPNRGPGSADGRGALAQFTQPTGTAVDAAGNIFVSDSSNHTIRKISPSGDATTIAGFAGTPGSNDGVGTAARFRNPIGLCIDPLGNLYVVDSGNQTIRKIARDLTVTTLAGLAGFRGYVDGPGLNARFSDPISIAVAIDGTLFLTDRENHRVRKITSSGVVSTVAGSGFARVEDGVGPAANFLGPNGIGLSTSGSLYVTDGHAVRRIDPDGTVKTIAGTADYAGLSADGEGAAARFGSPFGVAVDKAGNVFVTDNSYNSIRKMTPTGTVTTLAGHDPGVVDGIGLQACFYGPTGIAINNAGELYVSDQYGNAIRKVTPSGAVTTVAGTASLLERFDGQGANARFNAPAGVAVDASGNVFVADYWNNAVRKVSPAGLVSTFAGSYATGPGAKALLNWPQSMAVDRAGNLFLVHNSSGIWRIAPTGETTLFAGDLTRRGSVDGTGVSARFSLAGKLAIDWDDNLYVVDGFSIRKINSAAVVTTIPLSTTQAAEPPRCDGLAVNPAGGFYAADSFNHVIWKIAPDGTSTVFAGKIGDYYGWQDGAAGVARFNQPYGIAVDRDGMVYVTELSHTIRVITPAGDVTSLGGVQGGSPASAGSVDAVGIDARFNQPKAIAVDAAGVLYIADYGNAAVRKGVPQGGMSITLQPISQTTIAGQTVTFSVAASGGELSYQWRKNSSPITANTSSTTSTLVLSNVNEADVAVYDCVVSSRSNSVVSSPASLALDIAPKARLVNIATRAYCSTGDNVTIGGFVVTGTLAKRVLIRAIGPSLGSQGLRQTDVLSDPMLEVYRGASVIASNDNWDGTAAAAEITKVGGDVGATPIAGSDHASAALLLTLDAGVYTFVARGNGDSSGILLLEIYDADPGSTVSKFVNIATRARASTGDGVTIGGFVISGKVGKQVLLRAVGPTLATQGISRSAVLADPMIELYRGGSVISANDDWTGNTNALAITSTAARVGASPFASDDTTSSALLLTLPPGAYTFLASGKSSATGIVLVEVYDAD